MGGNVFKKIEAFIVDESITKIGSAFMDQG